MLTFSPGTRLDADARISVLDPLRAVDAALLDLLRGFTEDDWRKPTVHRNRDVKDLTAHMLHGCLRSITGDRDHYESPMPFIGGLADLITFIQQDNREFMAGMRRISPQILVELIALYEPRVLAIFEQLDPDETGCGVGWAGEDESRVWFGIAREYTEKWHHQAQLRMATDRPPLYDPSLFEPVLETFARGLPFAFRGYEQPVGASLAVTVSGPVDLGWTLRRDVGGWSLWSGAEASADTRVSLPADVAWRVWTKSMARDEARPRVVCVGDRAVLDTLLGFVAIMA